MIISWDREKKKQIASNILFLSHAYEHSSGCWIWDGAKDKHGRGKTFIGKKSYTAPRASWIRFIGNISKDQMVCHKCDNPSCINPDHLFLGTQLDNVTDMINKGRKHYKPSATSQCHPNKPHKALGLCSSCYRHQYYEKNS